MIKLTDRQRFALRESLCDVLSGYSEEWYSTSWDAEAVDQVRKMVSGKKIDTGWSRGFKRVIGLLELLGEWPVGFRGKGGWEPIECKP